MWAIYRPGECRTPIMNRFYPVFVRAELLRELGRPEEALGWYEALSFPFFTLSSGLGTRRLVGRAAALEAMGRNDETEVLREQVRAQWQGPGIPLP